MKAVAAGAAPPLSTPLTGSLKVSGVFPPAGALETDPSTTVSVYFDQALDTQPSASALTLRSAAGPVTGSLSYSASEKQLTFSPAQRLLLRGQFTASIDRNLQSKGSPQLETYPSWSFTVRDGQWQPSTVIDISPSEEATTPQIALDAAGNAVAVWHQDDGTAVSIWSNYYDVETGWETAVRVESNDSHDAINPKVDMNAQGRATVVWVQSDGVEQSVWSSFREPQSGWSTAVLVETSDAEIGSYPSVHMDAAGKSVVLWSQIDGLAMSLWANQHTIDEGWKGARTLEQNALDAVTSISMSLNAAGKGMAIWSQHDGIEVSIWINHFDGENWAGPELIESYHGGPSSIPSLALNEAAEVIAVWAQKSSENMSLWSRSYSPVEGWRDAVLNMPDSAASVGNLRVSLDNLGNAMCIWQQSDDIVHSYFSHGASWSSPALIEFEDGKAVKTVIEMEPNTGNVIAAWRQSKSSGPRDIWSSRFLRDTGWSAPQLLEHDDSGHAVKPRVAINNSGAALVVWGQSDGTHFRVHAARFD